MRITGFQLHIRNPETALTFYTRVLGMRLHHTQTADGFTVYTLASEGSPCRLTLRHSHSCTLSPYTLHAGDNYWKYSLFVDDIQRVYQRLLACGHAVSEPFQLDEIGYLAHTADTENHAIEFIQKTFRNSTPLPVERDSHAPLGECPVPGLVTVRTTDPIKAIRFYERFFEMKLLVRMTVKRGSGFTLYFLGDSQLIPPEPDMDAVANREWLYQQNGLFIEIQHYWGNQGSDFALNTGHSDLHHIRFRGDTAMLKKRLDGQRLVFAEKRRPCTGQSEVHVRSPDGHKIIVEELA